MSDSKTTSHSVTSLEDVVRRIASCDLHGSNRLWLAFSGGVDSTVLLHVASRAFKSDQLAVVHVNHGLSLNADAWELHCEEVVSQLGIDFTSRRVSLDGTNLEFEGRQARSRIFDEVMRDGDTVATAHHRDDELESLMWQLATGRALVGIATWRQLEYGRMWRPLLSYQRVDLQRIAHQNDWTWIEDESNQDVSLARNALRHEVLPRLRASFTGFDANLLRLKEPALELLPRKPISAELLAIDAIKVRAWLHAYNITPRNTVVDEIMRQAAARHDAQVCIRVSPRNCVRRFKGMFYVVADAVQNSDISLQVGESACFSFGELTWIRDKIGLATDTPIRVGSRGGGESLHLNRGCVSLSRWFYDQKVPPWERDAWPLLYLDRQLVAVPGLGVSASVCTEGGWVPQWRRFQTS